MYELIVHSRVLSLLITFCFFSEIVAAKKSLQCSLNGWFQQNKNETTSSYHCNCQRPWKGSRCEYLDFLPVKFPQGYGMTPNHTSWGGNIIYEEEKDLYHLFVSTMTNGCSLAHWTKNSRIDHAVSKTPGGPFLFKDVAIPTWAHNAAPIEIPNKGGYAIFHVGKGDGPANGGDICRTRKDDTSPSYFKRGSSSGISLPFSRRDLSSPSSSATSGSNIHTSHSLDGPWFPLTNNTLGHCNNPSPFYHPLNASLFIACNHREILRSDNGLYGPWTKVTTIDTEKGPDGHYEDPYLWIDEELNFHILFHVYRYNEYPPHGHDCTNSMVSAHAYSKDGIQEWHFGSNQPYTTQIPTITLQPRNSNRSQKQNITVVATRERPFLMWNTKGEMTHLVTAVCGAEACPTGPPQGCVDCKYDWWDYTLVAPLVTS